MPDTRLRKVSVMTKFFRTVAVLALAIYGNGLANAQEATTDKAPSARAICGYKWREAKKADPTLKGRDAWSAFQSAECGSKSKTRNDDAIKRYLDSQKTEIEPIDEYEDRPVILLAKFKKK